MNKCFIWDGTPPSIVWDVVRYLMWDSDIMRFVAHKIRSLEETLRNLCESVQETRLCEAPQKAPSGKALRSIRSPKVMIPNFRGPRSLSLSFTQVLSVFMSFSCLFSGVFLTNSGKFTNIYTAVNFKKKAKNYQKLWSLGVG